MCFDRDARPPDLPADLWRAPLAGGAAAEILELTSADGTRFSAALARSGDADTTAVVILPDVRGLYRFYVELAERFAHAGHDAVAIDYFGRTAGTGERDEDFDFWPHVTATTLETVQADTAAAATLLREGGATRIVTVGFCFGGAHAFLSATSPELDLDRAIGFYGSMESQRFDLRSRIEAAADARCPVLGLFGGDDPGIPPEHVAAFDARLDEAGVEHEVVIYPGAPHSFFDRSFEQYRSECDDAWRRVLAFI